MSQPPKFPKGWKVISLPAGSKEADLPGWPTLATDDPAQIAKWHSERPGCNWALVVGASGLGVVDIDPPIGEDSLFQFELEHEQLPATREHQSARGGRHLIFSDPERRLKNTASKLGPKIDTRGGGDSKDGYILIPPSTFDGKPYTVTQDIPLAPLPQFVADAAGASRERVAASEGVELDTPANRVRASTLLAGYIRDKKIAREGQGGDTNTYAVAAEVMSLGLSPEAALEIMLPWNEACEPPWSIDELRTKISNASEYAQNDPGAFAVLPVSDRVPNLAEHLADNQASIAAKEAPKSGNANPFRLIRPSEFGRIFKPLSYIIDPFVPEQSTIFHYGPDQSLKTLFNVALGISVAANKPLLDRYPIKRSGPVVYLAGEDPNFLALKIFPSMCQRLGIDPKSLDGKFHLVANLPMINDPAEIDLLITAAKDSEDEPVLIITDTLTRMMAGLRFNDPDTGAAVTHQLDRIQRELNCSLIAIGHTGQNEDNELLGSKVMMRNADVRFQFFRPNKKVPAVRIVNRKQKRSALAPDLLIEGRPDAFGMGVHEITEAAFKKLVVNGSSQPAKPPTKADELAKRIAAFCVARGFVEPNRCDLASLSNDLLQFEGTWVPGGGSENTSDARKLRTDIKNAMRGNSALLHQIAHKPDEEHPALTFSVPGFEPDDGLLSAEAAE